MNTHPAAARPIWRSLHHLARYNIWLYLLSGLLASIPFYTFPLVVALIVRQIFNTLSGEAPVAFDLRTLFALLVGMAVIQELTRLGAMASEATLQLTIRTLLRRNVLAHVLQRPGASALPASPGEAVSRLRDDADAISMFLTHILDFAGQALALLFGLGVLIRIQPTITLAVFVPLLAIVAAIRVASQRIHRYRRARQEATGAITGLLGEVFGAVQAVKVAGTERHVVEHFAALNEARRKATLQDVLISELLHSFSANVANVGTGIFLLMIARTMQAGAGETAAFTVGDFSLFVSYLGSLAFSVGAFGNVLTMYRQTEVSFDRLIRLMEESAPEALVAHQPVYLWGKLPELPYTPKTGAHRLEVLTVRGLTYHYPDSDKGIEEVDLTLRRGTLTVITGRIGAGKTTLLRVFLGLLPQEQGEICWNGAPVRNPATFFVPPRCAYTPQVPRLFSETLRDNILMGLPETHVDLPAALRLAALQRDVAALAEGLETVVGARGVKLSGGQIQRTAAARMFVRTPALLVFDDLSSALDVETERALWDGIFAQLDLTCLVVSHRPAVLQRADQVIVLQDGRIEESSTERRSHTF